MQVGIKGTGTLTKNGNQGQGLVLGHLLPFMLLRLRLFLSRLEIHHQISNRRLHPFYLLLVVVHLKYHSRRREEDRLLELPLHRCRIGNDQIMGRRWVVSRLKGVQLG
jgi:hypothetical protein